MKTIVTHIGPDADAITAIWIVKTFWPGWEEAGFAFVPAGSTLDKLPSDDNPDIVHVDTGMGKFDHHQSDADTCAAKLTYEEVVRQKGEDQALSRLVAVINEVDHFREVYFPNPTSDYYYLGFVSALDGWRILYSHDPIKIVSLGLEVLDGMYKTFQNKVAAEHELKEKAILFETKWGKAIGIQTGNDEVIHLAQKMGYVIAVRKDPNNGSVRIKSLPEERINLTELYQQLKKEEPAVTWFLHASLHMVLNGSSKNPDYIPSQKTLPQVIDCIRSL